MHRVFGRRAGLLIAADNTGDGWCGPELVAQAAFDGRAVAVAVPEHLLALDCDPAGTVAALRAAEAGERIVAALRAAGCDPVVLSSGRAGGWHLVCRVDDAGLRDRLRRMARRAGIDTRSGGARLRLPGSPHRLGLAVTLHSHPSWGAAAAALARPAPQPAARGAGTFPAGGDRSRPHPSGPLAELIRDGDLHGRFLTSTGRVDGSRLTMAICARAAAECLSADQVFAWLTNPVHLGGEALRRRLARGQAVGRAWFVHTWSKAASGARRRRVGSRADALAELDRVEAAAAGARFSGRAAGSMVAVLSAALGLARERGGPVCPMSVRELAERAGVNVSTVRPALARLRLAGWVHLVACSEGDRAAVYGLRVPVGCDGVVGGRAEPAHEQFPSGGVGTVRIWRDLLGEDAFGHGALGKTGLRVLEALSRGVGPSPRALAGELGMHPGSVRRTLARLRAAGLVDDAEGGLAVAEPAGCGDRLRAAAGCCAGRADRRARRHRQDREAFREWLADREAAGRGLVRWPRRPETVLGLVA